MIVLICTTVICDGLLGFSAGSLGLHTRGTIEWPKEPVLDIERLVRRILMLPSRPAVIMIEVSLRST